MKTIVWILLLIGSQVIMGMGGALGDQALFVVSPLSQGTVLHQSSDGDSDDGDTEPQRQDNGSVSRDEGAEFRM